MRKATVLISLLCLLALAAMPAFARGGTETAAPKGDGKVVWAAYGYLAQNKSTRIIDAFKVKYPQFEVTYTDLGSKDYITILDTMVAAGERVDMALAMDYPAYASRARTGYFLPIESHLTKDGFSLKEGFGSGLNASYIDGKLYGLPYTKGGFYVFYNKDMFDKAGIAYPTDDWTWEEFEAIAKKLTTGSGKEKVYGANVHWTWGGFDIEALPALQQGWTPFKDDNPKQANMNDPRLGSALEMWNRMQNVDKTAVALATFKAEQITARVPFSKGQAAMLLSNWWSAQWLINAKFGSADGVNVLNFKIGVVNVPRASKSIPNNLNLTDLDWYFTVPKTAKTPEGGALLARFMITEMWPKFGTLSSYLKEDMVEFKKNFTSFVGTDGKISTVDYPDEFVNKVMGNWAQPISAYYNQKKDVNPVGLGMIKTIYDQEHELFYLGQQDLAKTLDSLQKRAMAELAAQK